MKRNEHTHEAEDHLMKVKYNGESIDIEVQAFNPMPLILSATLTTENMPTKLQCFFSLSQVFEMLGHQSNYIFAKEDSFIGIKVAVLVNKIMIEKMCEIPLVQDSIKTLKIRLQILENKLSQELENSKLKDSLPIAQTINQVYQKAHKAIEEKFFRQNQLYAIMKLKIKELEEKNKMLQARSEQNIKQLEQQNKLLRRDHEFMASYINKMNNRISFLEKVVKEDGEGKLEDKKEIQLLGGKAQVLQQKYIAILEQMEFRRRQQKFQKRAKRCQQMILAEFDPVIKQKIPGERKKKVEEQVKKQGARDKKKCKPGIDVIESQYTNEFEINGKIITYRREGFGNYTQLLIQRNIKFYEREQFEWRVYKKSGKNMFLGIIDWKKGIKDRSSAGSIYAVGFVGFSGEIYFGKGKSIYLDSGFKGGDLVKIIVTLVEGKIAWQVNGKQVGSCLVPILKDKNREFVPYVEMFDGNDTIEWLS